MTKQEKEAAKTIIIDALISAENYIFAIVEEASDKPNDLAIARNSFVERMIWLKEFSDK